MRKDNQLCIRISSEDLERAKQRAADKKISLAGYIMSLINEDEEQDVKST